jgi:hypothetical protein
VRASQKRAAALRQKLKLANENDYYDLHGRFPEGSTRINPVAPEDQFYSDFTDSAAQQYNRTARVYLDDSIAQQVSKLDPETQELLNSVRAEGLIYDTTGRLLSKPNKKGKSALTRKDVSIDSTQDEALEIDLGNAEAFVQRADTTDPRTLSDEGREQFMRAETNRFAADLNNPLISAVLEAADLKLNQSGWTALGNAATGGKGRERARSKGKDEVKVDGKRLLAQEAFGISGRTGAQIAGRGQDIEHAIAANLIGKYNNEGVNKYPGPKYLNRAYGDAAGPEQLRLAKQHLSELHMLKGLMDNPELTKQVVQEVPELYRNLGVKPATIQKNMDARYSDKFDRFTR